MKVQGGIERENNLKQMNENIMGAFDDVSFKNPQPLFV